MKGCSQVKKASEEDFVVGLETKETLRSDLDGRLETKHAFKRDLNASCTFQVRNKGALERELHRKIAFKSQRKAFYARDRR